MRLNTQLMDQITKMEPLEFAGLAKLLGISIVEPNSDADAEKKMVPRSFADVLSDVMAKFTTLNRTKKRDLLKLIKKSNAQKRGY